MKTHKLITGSWIAALAAALTIITAEPATFAATTGTWAGNGTTSSSGSWSDSSNWSGGTIPGATTGTTNGDTALFTLAAPTYGTSANPVVIDLGRNLEFITFDLNAAAYVVGSTTGPALVLTSGGTLQNASTLVSGNVETVNAPLTLEGNYTIANNSGSNSSALEIGGNITAAANSTLTLSGNNISTSNALSGTLAPGAGTLALTKSGAGFWAITGTNTNYAGTTTLNNGILSINNASALGLYTIITLNGGALDASSALTSSNALNDNFNVSTNSGTSTAIYADIGGSSSIATSGSLTFNGSIAAPSVFTNNLTSGNTFTVSGTTYLANNGSTIGEAIFDGPGATSLSTINGGPGGNSAIASIFDYYGSGTLTLNGAINSKGAQYLLGGTVVLNDASSPVLNSADTLLLGSNLQVNGTEAVKSTTIAGETGAIYSPSITNGGSGTIALGLITFSVDPILFQSGVATATNADLGTGYNILELQAISYNGSRYDFATTGTGTAGTANSIVNLPDAGYTQAAATTGANGYVELQNAGGLNYTNTTIGAESGLRIDTSNSSSPGTFVFGRSNVYLSQWYGYNGIGILYSGIATSYTISGAGLESYPSTGNGGIFIEQYDTAGPLTIANLLFGPVTATGTSATSGTNETLTNFVQTGNISVGLVKGGPGTLILTNNNEYGGPTSIAQGTLSIGSDSNIGGMSGTVTVNSTSGTTVNLSAAPSTDLIGVSLLGSTVTAVNGATLTLAAAPGTAVTTPTVYAYANGTQSLSIDGTLEATGNFTLGETATAASGTVTNYRPVYLDVDGGTFQVDPTYTLTVPGIIKAGGATGVTNDVSLTKTGTGTLVLSGANTYAGGTVVSVGTLFANTPTGSATGQGGVTVANGATLGGTGVIAPNGLSGASYGYVPDASVTIQGGGTLAPGGVQTAGQAPNGSLTLTANATYSPVVLDLLSNATLKFALGTNLGANASSELVLSLSLPGEVVFNNNVISINDLTSGNLSGVYTLFAPTGGNPSGSDYSGLTLGNGNVITGGLSLASSFTSVSPYYADSYLYLDPTTGNIDLEVPEPKTFALLLLGAAFLFYQRRKLRNQA